MNEGLISKSFKDHVSFKLEINLTLTLASSKQYTFIKSIFGLLSAIF